jgi:hypothetical protein
MRDQPIADLDALVEEITQYLAAIDVFRALNCEPTWRPEYGHFASARAPEPPLRTVENSAH